MKSNAARDCSMPRISNKNLQLYRTAVFRWIEIIRHGCTNNYRPRLKTNEKKKKKKEKKKKEKQDEELSK